MPINTIISVILFFSVSVITILSKNISLYYLYEFLLIADSDDCKQCPRVLAEIEHIDDEADGAGINFVRW